MLLSSLTIDALKAKSGLGFDRASDFIILADLIGKETGHSIGATTLKRLLGYIDDPRQTNKSTLNLIARYLGHDTWEEYENSIRIDSEWNFQSDSVWIDELDTGQNMIIGYLNRQVRFEVVNTDAGKALKVIQATNSSLKVDDILFIDKIDIDCKLEARRVLRGSFSGTYKTNGEIKTIRVE